MCAKGVSQVSQLSQANKDGAFVGVQGVTKGVTGRHKRCHRGGVLECWSIGVLENQHSVTPIGCRVDSWLAAGNGTGSGVLSLVLH
jgi:hypothetical protein